MTQYCIVLFYTTSSVMRAEKLLIKEGYFIKLIPTPRQFSSDCGIAVRFDCNDREQIKEVLDEARVEFDAVYEAPFSALVFKTLADPFAGKLNLFKVMSGKIDSESIIFNSTKKAKERLGQLLSIEGRKQSPINEASVGVIAAVAKLKETTTGDTLCDRDQRGEEGHGQGLQMTRRVNSHIPAPDDKSRGA